MPTDVSHKQIKFVIVIGAGTLNGFTYSLVGWRGPRESNNSARHNHLFYKSIELTVKAKCNKAPCVPDKFAFDIVATSVRVVRSIRSCSKTDCQMHLKRVSGEN